MPPDPQSYGDHLMKVFPAAGIPYRTDYDTEVIITEGDSYDMYSAFAEKNGILSAGLRGRR